MAVTWNVVSLDSIKTVGSLSDVVTTVYWTAFDSETVGSGDSAVVHTVDRYGSVELAEADSGSFTAYADITKNNAIAWAKAALGSDEVTKVETDIAAKITEIKNPTVISGVPSAWSS
tara:strand:- start:371 stop:721 length:351 start_codon:yes stop_codon:yes gene_type:complete